LPLPTPVRAVETDDPAEVLGFALESLALGGVALATLVEIRGGAARALGSHVAVAADGRFCGYVSGGCVETALATEALLALAEGCDRIVKFGDGSPFFDIVLPCGGGITVAIHLLREGSALRHVLGSLDERECSGLAYSLERQTLAAVEAGDRPSWIGGEFITVYRPRTRVVVSGQGIEATVVSSLAHASGFEVVAAPHANIPDVVRMIDAFTAVVLLHHDVDAEDSFLRPALASEAFYIGALGSNNTHRRRVHRLMAVGIGRAVVARIKAPIGLFGPTKDSNSLALSILADIAGARLAAFN